MKGESDGIGEIYKLIGDPKGGRETAEANTRTRSSGRREKGMKNFPSFL